MKKRLIEIKNRLVARARRQPKRAAAAGVLLLLLLFVVGRSFTHSPMAQNNYYTVKRRDFLISIVEGGTLKAVQEVTVRNELEGTSRILSIVPEGTSVKSGDLLFELDSSDLRDRLSAQEVTYQNIQFAFLQATETLAIQKSLAESNIKEAELKLEFAGSDLDALRRMLSRARTLVEMQPGSWEVVTGTQTEPVRRDILATVHRAAFLELLDTWDRLVTRAQETGRSIVCLGD